MPLKNILEKPLLRYVAPFILFMVLTELQRFGSPTGVFYIYGLKVVLTAAALFLFFHNKPQEFEGSFKDPRAVILGIVVLVLWLIPALLSKDLPKDILFNPQAFSHTSSQIAAILIRTAGAALVVPVMEELLWRSFLMRYLIQSDFLKIPLGTFQWVSFTVTAAAFTLVHRPWEWPAAAITGVLYGGYLVKTKNLKGCIVAHGVTNLGLAVFTVATQQWFFW